jgi:hypothetical protein
MDCANDERLLPMALEGHRRRIAVLEHQASVGLCRIEFTPGRAGEIALVAG